MYDNSYRIRLARQAGFTEFATNLHLVRLKGVVATSPSAGRLCRSESATFKQLSIHDAQVPDFLRLNRNSFELFECTPADYRDTGVVVPPVRIVPRSADADEK